MIPTSSSLTVSFFTTSYIFSFNRCWGCLEGLCSSSRRIRCMQDDGLIPLISSMLYSMAPLYFQGGLNNFAIWVPSRLALTIIGKVSFRPRNSYLKWEGNGFNFTLAVYFLASLEAYLHIKNLPWMVLRRQWLSHVKIMCICPLSPPCCTSTLLSRVPNKQASRGSEGGFIALISSKTTLLMSSTQCHAYSRDGEAVTFERLNSSFKRVWGWV